MDDICRIGEILKSGLDRGRKVLTCGNGGSACEAMHFAEELMGRYRSNRCAYPAICLNADVGLMTCIANDFGFDEVFARQVEGLGRSGDILLVFSTSGTSKNILRAIKVGVDKGMIVIGFLGKDGGESFGKCDYSVVVKSNDSGHIQEAHQALVHLIMEYFENERGND